MTYNTSYDTMGNYQEPVNQTPVARAVPSQLEDKANTEVPELPTKGRKSRKKQWIIRSLIVGAVLGSLAGVYTLHKIGEEMNKGIQTYEHIHNSALNGFVKLMNP